MTESEKQIESQQGEKVDFLINNGFRQIEIQIDVFDKLDSKIMRFFLLVATTEGYFVVEHFTNKRINIFYTHDFLLLFLLLVGLVILMMYVFTLRSKTFHTGPDVYKQTKQFRSNEYQITDLKKDVLGSINSSIDWNRGILSIKSSIFKNSIYLIVVYYILIILYFFFLKNG